MKQAVVLVVLAVLAGCGGDDSRTAGGVTPNEARALDDAAQIIEERRVADEVLVPPTLSPAPAASGSAAPQGQAGPGRP